MSRWGDDWTKPEGSFPGGRTRIMSYVATSKVPTLENVLSIGARLIEKTGAIFNHSPPLLPRPSSTTSLQNPIVPATFSSSRSNTRSQESVAGTLPIATLSSPTNPLSSPPSTQLTSSSRSTWPPKQPSPPKQHAPSHHTSSLLEPQLQKRR